jgi:phage shock protein C
MDYKRLYRSNHDIMLGGVCGGLGEYFNIDPTIVRLVFVLLGFVTALFPALILYFILWVIVPRNPAG